jgi:DNA modification methylase
MTAPRHNPAVATALSRLADGSSQGEFVIGKAEEIIPAMPDACVDLVFADLPFNFGKDWVRFGERPASLPQDNLSPGEYRKLCWTWMWHCARVLKRHGSLYVMTAVQHLKMMLFILEPLAYFQDVIVWPNSSIPREDRYTPAWQPILWYTKNEDDFIYHCSADGQMTNAAIPYGRRPGGFRMTNVWDDIKFIAGGCMASAEAILMPDSKKKMHAAQMPIGLARRAILASSEPGMLVADFFVGSGTTAEAALKTGRRYLCSDADPRCIAISKERINRVLAAGSWQAAESMKQGQLSMDFLRGGDE